MTKGVEKAGRRTKVIIWSQRSKRTGGIKGTLWKQLGRRICSKQLSRRIWTQLGRRIPPHPPHPEEVNEKLNRRILKQLGRRIRPQPPHPKEVNKKAVLLHVMSELGLKSGIKRTMSLLGGRIMDIGSR